VAVVQPDLAKWGGVSGVLGVIERISARGCATARTTSAPGIGLLASAHVLAANARADGWLEVDANENPLRTMLCPPLATLRAGAITLGSAPGLGVEPDLAALRALCAAGAAGSTAQSL
jgi:L-alanine-DL-glutamate epimerase-like enolase superfamily enzyme